MNTTHSDGTKTKKYKKGAPIGGRVHWLLMFLSKEFNRDYRLEFDYEYHNYHFARYEGRRVKDEFIIVRTSRSCFRVMYFNAENTYFEYFAEKTARECAEHIEELYRKIRYVENARGI